MLSCKRALILFLLFVSVVIPAQAGGGVEEEIEEAGESGDCGSGQITDCAFTCFSEADINAQVIEDDDKDDDNDDDNPSCQWVVVMGV